MKRSRVLAILVCSSVLLALRSLPDELLPPQVQLLVRPASLPAEMFERAPATASDRSGCFELQIALEKALLQVRSSASPEGYARFVGLPVVTREPWKIAIPGGAANIGEKRWSQLVERGLLAGVPEDPGQGARSYAHYRLVCAGLRVACMIHGAPGRGQSDWPRTVREQLERLGVDPGFLGGNTQTASDNSPTERPWLPAELVLLGFVLAMAALHLAGSFQEKPFPVTEILLTGAAAGLVELTLWHDARATCLALAAVTVWIALALVLSALYSLRVLGKSPLACRAREDGRELRRQGCEIRGALVWLAEGVEVLERQRALATQSGALLVLLVFPFFVGSPPSPVLAAWAVIVGVLLGTCRSLGQLEHPECLTWSTCPSGEWKALVLILSCCGWPMILAGSTWQAGASGVALCALAHYCTLSSMAAWTQKEFMRAMNAANPAS